MHCMDNIVSNASYLVRIVCRVEVMCGVPNGFGSYMVRAFWKVDLR